MSRPFIVRVLVDDLPLKLLSLVIAIALFFFVRGDRDATAGINVKLLYELPADRVLVSEIPSSLHVGLRGPWSRVSRLDEADVEPVHLDLSHIVDGEVRIHEDLIRLPPGLMVASISPLSFSVRFETRQQKEVPVLARTEGTPAEGFHVGRIRVAPATVKVDGAQSALRGLAHLETVALDITGADGRIKGEVGYRTPARVRVLGPARASVDVDVVATSMEKTLSDVPVKDAPRPDMRVTVVLRGPEAVVRGLSHKDLEVSWAATAGDRARRGTLRVSGVPESVTAEVRATGGLLLRKR